MKVFGESKLDKNEILYKVSRVDNKLIVRPVGGIPLESGIVADEISGVAVVMHDRAESDEAKLVIKEFVSVKESSDG
jgi:hypothetical protein